MQLEIYNPTQGTQLPTIEWNFDALKTWLEDGLASYKGRVYDDSQINEAKKDASNLRKLKEAIDGKRKELKAVKRRINAMVGGAEGQRFISGITSAVSVNPSLSECDHSTILSAALLGESLKLSPSPQLGYYYMVPFNDKKHGRKVAQFQLGYKGYIQLAIRSGQYKKINVLAIKEGELEYFDPLNEEIRVNLMVENWDEREAAKTIGYYAMFELVNGFRKAMYWSFDQMLAHADKYSNAFSAAKYRDLLDGKIPQSEMWKYSSFWYKDFDGMAYKTMLRQLISKWGIMSVEMQTAMTNDMGSINDDGTVDYVDNNEEVVIVPNEPPQDALNDLPQDTAPQTDAVRDFFGEEVEG